VPGASPTRGVNVPRLLLGREIGQMAWVVGFLIEVVAGAHPVEALGDGPPVLAWRGATQA